MIQLARRSRRRLAIRLAPWMFAVAIVFLASVAALIVITVDANAIEDRIDPVFPRTYRLASLMLAITWPLFWMEALFHWLVYPWDRTNRGGHLKWLAFAIFPPLRMCARNSELGNRIWFPRIGWRLPDERLRDYLTRLFSGPVLCIAVLILPVLGIEFFLAEQVERFSWLQGGLMLSTGLIWVAFTTEFIVMVSVAERKLDYCKRHWIDLAIILLPLVSFLRTLQLLRATRLAQVARVPQLTKMARVYRLRGVSTKALRAFVLLDLTSRLLRTSPEKRIARLRLEHARLSKEIQEIDRRIESIEQQHATPNSCKK